MGEKRCTDWYIEQIYKIGTLVCDTHISHIYISKKTIKCEIAGTSCLLDRCTIYYYEQPLV